MRFIVFTKPWKNDLPAVAAKVKALGFDGVELPVRPGYPVHPENVSAELPKAARLFKDHGLTIESVAGPTDAATIAACAQSGIGVIRTMLSLPKNETYSAAEARFQRELDALVPLLDRHKVTVGVQNHSGRYVPVHAMGLARLVSRFNPRHVAGVWDAAHNALEGEEPEMALDLIYGPHLRIVNLKNGVKQRGADGVWRTQWVGARDGVASWPRVVGELKRRRWDGVVCLTNEYSDEKAVDRLIAEDIAYARSLFAAS